MKKPTPPVNPLAALPQVGAAPAAAPMPMPKPSAPKGKGPKKGKDFGFTKSK